VGYGDIVSKNSVEKIFSTILVFCGCAIFAYLISSIGAFLQEMIKEKEAYWRDIGVINRYMKRNNIGLDLKTKINKYIEYLWNDSKEQEINEEKNIIDQLSSALQEDLLFRTYLPIMKQFPIISTALSDDCLKKVARVIKEKNFSPNEKIFSKNEVRNQEIFLIHEGKVQIIAQATNPERSTVLKVLEDGDSFGAISFFSGKPRTESVYSIDHSSVYSIEREEFLKVLREFPEDYEKICYIRDQMTIYNNHTLLEQHCFSCREPNHTASQCPLLHHKPAINYILYKYTYSQPQERESTAERKAR